jgi:hypothetical protein
VPPSSIGTAGSTVVPGATSVDSPSPTWVACSGDVLETDDSGAVEAEPLPHAVTSTASTANGGNRVRPLSLSLTAHLTAMTLCPAPAIAMPLSFPPSPPPGEVHTTLAPLRQL